MFPIIVSNEIVVKKQSYVHLFTYVSLLFTETKKNCQMGQTHNYPKLYIFNICTFDSLFLYDIYRLENNLSKKEPKLSVLHMWL